MKKYLILACILLQYAIMLDKVWAAEYPTVSWGASEKNFGNIYDNSNIAGNSSYDLYLNGDHSQQTYTGIFYNANYDYFTGQIRDYIGIINNTPYNYIAYINLCAPHPDYRIPVFDSSDDNINNYFFNTTGWTDYLQSNNMNVSEFSRNEASTYIESASDFFSENLSVNALLSEADMVGSILVDKFGSSDTYNVNEFGDALNEFCAGLFGVSEYNSNGRICTLGSYQRIYTTDTYTYRLSGANTLNTIADFSVTKVSDFSALSKQDMIDSYNSTTGVNFVLYTNDELENIFNAPSFDGDISLGTGSTNNFKDLLLYLFKPSYTGIEDNYNDLVSNLGILYMPIDYINSILGTVSGTYDSDMVLSWDNIDVFGITLSGDTFRFTPSDILPSSMSSFWTVFQYFAMFVVLMGLTIHTYRHLFSSNGEEGGSAI